MMMMVMMIYSDDETMMMMIVVVRMIVMRSMIVGVCHATMQAACAFLYFMVAPYTHYKFAL